MSNGHSEHNLDTRVTALELQTGRLVSDVESDKINHRDIHTRMWDEIQKLQWTVWGGEKKIGLNARMEANEQMLLEIRKIVKDLQRSAWMLLGAFAILKIVFDVIIK